MTRQHRPHRASAGTPPPAAFLSRRQVVSGAVVMAGGTALHVSVGGPELLDAVLAAGAPRVRTVVERVRRSSDLLVGNIVLRDLDEVVEGRTTYLTPRSGATNGYLALVLPGQSLGELVVPEGEPLPPGGLGTVPAAGARLAAPTVLAFTVPAGKLVPYDVTGLLTWESFAAQTTTSGERFGTSVEAPYRLRLKTVPGRHVWSKPPPPPGPTTGPPPVSELWHVRARGKPTVGLSDDRTASLAGFDDLGYDDRGALDPADRANIAIQSNGQVSIAGEAVKAPVELNHLALTSLGATIDLTGRWPGADELLAWDHRSTLGRDQYVKTVNRGFLAPWGHDAVLVTETWRRMRQDGTNPPEALLVKTTTLLVSPDVDTSVEFARGTNGLRLPFLNVRCTVASTPKVTNEAEIKLSPGGFVEVDHRPLTLPFVGTDWTGRQVPLSCQVWYVPRSTTGSAAAGAYNDPQHRERRRVDLGGHPVAVAAPDENVPGGTTMPLTDLTAQITPITKLGQRKRAPFRPESDDLRADVPQVSALSGGGLVRHGYHPAYTKNPANVGGVVLARTGEEVPGSIGGERTGGLVGVPSYQGLSRSAGAVMASSLAALADCATGTAPAPANVFSGIELLGGIQLTDIVDIDNSTIGIPSSVPTVRSVDVDGRQTVTMTIRPELTSFGNDLITFLARADADSDSTPGTLEIVAKAAAGGTAPAETSVDARLANVALELAGLVVLPIREFHVNVRTGAPLDIDFVTGDISFLGPLAFLQKLCEVLSYLAPAAGAAARPMGARPTGARPAGAPASGAAIAATDPAGIEPPSVDVDETGLSLFQGIALPDLPLGAFTLTGLSFGFGLRLPFSGALVIDLSFASKESPFQATYLCFGGGGYAVVQLTGGDVSLVEVGVHVAGEIGMNLGVASGSLSVAVGVVLALPGAGGVELTAYFRACGRLSVLELVTVSATFELSLTFVEPATGPTMLSGKASLELKVEVLFVSKTVTATVTRTLAGGNPGQKLPPASDHLGSAKKHAPPTRAELTANPDGTNFGHAYPDAGVWSEYCRAYAPAGGAQ